MPCSSHRQHFGQSNWMHTPSCTWPCLSLTSNSQSCESSFRTARSSSGPFSSVTNFSLKDFLRICQKLSILNSVKNCQQNTNTYQLRFPHHHKSDNRARRYNIDTSRTFELTEDDIETIIGRAFDAAREYVSMTNMGGSNNMGSLSDLSRSIKIDLNRSFVRITKRTKDKGEHAYFWTSEVRKYREVPKYRKMTIHFKNFKRDLQSF